jgi:hypothetical protein
MNEKAEEIKEFLYVYTNTFIYFFIASTQYMELLLTLSYDDS